MDTTAQRPELIERIVGWCIWGFLTVGMALLAVRPGALVFPGGGWLAAALIHLITLGGMVSSYYLLTLRLLPRLYGRTPAGRWVMPLVLLLHIAGVIIMVAGLVGGHKYSVYWGGHYLVPTGIVIVFIQWWVTAWKRSESTERHLAAHLPGIGLVVAMCIGALLVMDAYSGAYGIYTPLTILIHFLSGGFLFFLPLMLVSEAVAEVEPGKKTDSPFSPTAQTLLPMAIAGGGVLAMTLAVTHETYQLGMPIGLLVLGGSGLWLGMPSGSKAGGLSFVSTRRSLWAAVGMLLLYIGIRALRGIEVEEALSLARFGVVLFLFGVGVPEALNLLLRNNLERRGETPDSPEPILIYLVGMFGTGLILAAMLAQVVFLAQMGGLIWLATLAWGGRVMVRGGTKLTP